MMRHLRSAAVVLAMAVGATGCHRDPAAEARRFEARADAYSARRQWKEAVVEYGNAIKAQPQNASLYYKRAQAYAAVGDALSAYGAFSRAGDLDPSNVDAQLKAATLLLNAGQYEAAGARAKLVVAADDRNATAHLLLGEALAGVNSSSAAIQQIHAAIDLDPTSASAWTTLGAAQYRGGHASDAKTAFEKAVALDPDSIAARLSLAEFLRATGDAPGAEREAKDALSRHPADRRVHQVLAVMYLSSGRTADAEPHLKAVADDDAGRLQLADFYLGMNRLPEARTILDSLTKSSSGDIGRGARLRLVSIEYATGQKPTAYRLIDQLIAEKPHRIDARLAKGRMLLQDGDASRAGAEAAEALKQDSGSVEAQYLAGLAAQARGDTRDAETFFQQVTALDPKAAAAHLQLARMKLARGEPAAAASAATQADALAPQDPDVVIVLARSLRATGDLKGAADYLKKRLVQEPRQRALIAELGWVQLAEHKLADASASFAKAHDLQPSLPEAEDGLVAVDLASGRPAAARQRLDRWLTNNPTDPHLRLLSAKVDLASGDIAAAARTLEALVESRGDLEAYALLGQVYASQGQIPNAIAQYQKVAPRVRAPAGPLTMIGLLEEASGNAGAARASYEEALAADPESGTAANNLAWIYASDGKFDAALRLATASERLLPKRPEPKDTVGWIKYQQGAYWEAAECFERAISAAPERAVYHYHLGLARLRDGRADEARLSLQRALDLGLNTGDAEAAKQALHP